MLQATVDLSTVDPGWPGNGRWRLGQGQGEPGAMVLPVDRVFVHHTFSTVESDWRRSIGNPCDYDQRTFGKVSYSHMLELASRILCECEGTHRGAHTIDGQGHSLNGVSFGLAVVGNFSSPNDELPQTPLGDDDVAMIAEAIRTAYVDPGLVTPDFQILGHHDSGNATRCPGDRLYDRLPDIRQLVAGSSPAPVSGDTGPSDPPLEWYVQRPFMEGDDIAHAQRVLRDGAEQDLGPTGDDGRYGPKTEAGVSNLQRVFGVRVDGIVGPVTYPILQYVAALHSIT